MTQLSNQPTEPGFYQATRERQRGLKTGRIAPREGRVSAWEETLQIHNLAPMHPSQVGSDNRGFDKNQGQLFDPETVVPRDKRSDEAIARGLGAPTGEIHAARDKQNPVLGAKPGFMPGLTTKQKVTAIRGMGQAMGTDTPMRDMMARRESLRSQSTGSKPDWYMGTDAEGNYDSSAMGKAPEKIQESAARVPGATSSGHIRTVAMTSPQMAWHSTGTTDDPQAHQTDRMSSSPGTFPNIVVAEDVARTANTAYRQDKNVSQAIEDRTFVSKDDRIAEVAGNKSMVEHPSALGSTPDSRQKAASNYLREVEGPKDSVPFPVQSKKSQKTANFDSSLNLSHKNKAVQRIAAQSWTADRHDVLGATGLDADSNEFKRVGMYELVATTGRRTAIKNRELPPNEQAIEWEAQRASKGLGKGNQMFVAGTGTDGSAPVIRPELVNAPTKSPAPKSRSMRRGGFRDTASDLGLDF